MKTKNSGRVDQWSHCVESRYVSSASGTDISTATEASSLDCHFCGVDSPPACGEKVVENPLSRVGHTHTHGAAQRRSDRGPLGGALAHNLNSHLKSLRQERKKNRKSSAKRARRKGRGSTKDDYLALDWGRETSLKNNLTSLKESPRNEESARKKAGGREGVYVHVCVHVCVCMTT